MTAEKILKIARGEIGVKESPANSNRVKYNNAYYGREVSGSNYPWCCAFVWWVFREAGAAELFYGGGRTAYCPTLQKYHKAQAVSGDYRPGDIIFFNFSGKTSAAHVGICKSWDGAYITTIDGNTGTGNEANGGAVMLRRRHKKYIVGAYRPAYEEEDIVTYDQWKEFMEQYRQELRDKPPAMPGLLEEAKAMGLTDGTRPRDLVTREEAAIMARAAIISTHAPVG